VERILLYKSEDVLGAKLFDLVVPSSREALKCLIEELIHPGKAKAARASAVAQARRGSKRRLPDQRVSGDETGTSKATETENAVGIQEVHPLKQQLEVQQWFRNSHFHCQWSR
jgi:hypothetical protein